MAIGGYNKRNSLYSGYKKRKTVMYSPFVTAMQETPWPLPSTFIITETQFKLLLQQEAEVGTLENPFFSVNTSLTGSPHQINGVKGGLDKNHNYFKSLMLMNQRDKDLHRHDHHDKPAQNAGAGKGYMRYNRDRTICWRQSKQPFFGIERIPVTPVSPLRKHCAWNKYSSSNSRSTAVTQNTRQLDQMKLKMNQPIERFSAAYNNKATPHKKWEQQPQQGSCNAAASRRVSKSYDVGVKKRHSVWSTVNQES